MEITMKNFATCLPEIEKAIDFADFISVDGEMTGLLGENVVTVYDTPAEYYAKSREGVSNFLLVQIGICTFKYDPDINKYRHKAFNFYVFPKPFKNCNDFSFSSQVSAINFLSNAGFDFNKLFKFGIPCLSATEEKALQEQLTTKYDYANDFEVIPRTVKIPVPDKHSLRVEEIRKKIENFLFVSNEEHELLIDERNGFVRKLIYQLEFERFSDKKFSLSTKWIDNIPYVAVCKGKTREEVHQENYKKDKKEIEELLGISKVFQYISNKKKLIVGHNMVMDVCHIIHRFFHPLPSSYSDFKDMVHQIFPRIVDTKYLCDTPPFVDIIRSSVVEHLVKQLHEFPFRFAATEPEDLKFHYTENDNKAHEAGYDAYITGLAFITLTSYLDCNNSQSTNSELNLDILKPYENRLYLMRIADYKCMNLTEEEPIPKRDHVFHMTFPQKWKRSDILQMFRSYGAVNISYNDQTSAWITLLEPEKASSIASDLIENQNDKDDKPFTIVAWNNFSRSNHDDSKEKTNFRFDPKYRFCTIF